MLEVKEREMLTKYTRKAYYISYHPESNDVYSRHNTTPQICIAKCYSYIS